MRAPACGKGRLFKQAYDEARRRKLELAVLRLRGERAVMAAFVVAAVNLFIEREVARADLFIEGWVARPKQICICSNKYRKA